MLGLLRADPAAFAIAALVLVLSLAAHEWAHAFAADRAGDRTARSLGRLSLDPLRHLSPVGTLMLVLVGFGWAKPVPVQPANFRRPRAGMLAVSLAGVTANLALALLAVAALGALGLRQAPDGGLGLEPGSPLAGQAGRALALGLLQAAQINVLLAVFNLLPVPPLDGAKALAAVAPAPLADLLAGAERYGFLLVIGLLLLFDEQVFALVGAATRLLFGLLP